MLTFARVFNKYVESIFNLKNKTIMKKIMMIAAMRVATVSANAQFEAGTFSLQPKLGVGVSWLSNMPDLPLGQALVETGVASVSRNKVLDKSPIAAASLGVEAEYQLAPQFSLAAGVNYSLQGGGWKDTDIPVDGEVVKLKDAKIELGYVNVPVTANLYLFKNFAVKAGVQFGFLTNASAKCTAEGDGKKVDSDMDMKDDFETVNISIPMGISYQFKTPIVLDLRYNLGLTKVNKDSNPGVKDLKNNMVELTVGYKFAL